MRYLDIALVLVSLPGVAVSHAQKPSSLPKSSVTTAVDGVLAAFQNSPLVGLSDDHAFSQEEDFYVSLISDPRFAKEARNVVVEFGNASQQQTIDRYVDGEDVPYVELRKVWGDTSYVGWLPTVTALGYINFYAAVRAANLKLSAKEHIHVWLGGKPIDWSTIKTRDDLSKVIGGGADLYPAYLIEEQILKKRTKALIIYGLFHFFDKGELAELIRQSYPGALFVITAYTGFVDRSCSEAFERTVEKWPTPAIAAVSGSELDRQINNAGCHILDVSNFADMTEAQKAKVRSEMEGQASLIVGNSLLYLGAAYTLTKSPLSPDLYLDPEFRKENDRRASLFGGSLDLWPSVKDNPMSPRYLRDYGGHPTAPTR